MNQKFPGVLDIVRIWFENYKGHGKIISNGSEDQVKAMQLNEINETNCDVILISSYEFMYEIKEVLENRKISQAIYEIYSNSCRSFLHTLNHLPTYPKSNKLIGPYRENDISLCA